MMTEIGNEWWGFMEAALFLAVVSIGGALSYVFLIKIRRPTFMEEAGKNNNRKRIKKEKVIKNKQHIEGHSEVIMNEKTCNANDNVESYNEEIVSEALLSDKVDNECWIPVQKSKANSKANKLNKAKQSNNSRFQPNREVLVKSSTEVGDKIEVKSDIKESKKKNDKSKKESSIEFEPRKVQDVKVEDNIESGRKLKKKDKAEKEIKMKVEDKTVKKEKLLKIDKPSKEIRLGIEDKSIKDDIRFKDDKLTVVKTLVKEKKLSKQEIFVKEECLSKVVKFDNDNIINMDQLKKEIKLEYPNAEKKIKLKKSKAKKDIESISDKEREIEKDNVYLDIRLTESPTNSLADDFVIVDCFKSSSDEAVTIDSIIDDSTLCDIVTSSTSGASRKKTKKHQKVISKQLIEAAIIEDEMSRGEEVAASTIANKSITLKNRRPRKDN